MILYALVDCNNFYASCERIFKPKLNGKPVVVLSNNDGCVIARSNEAKALNIKMGVPYWEVKKLIKEHNIAVFSSNYQLYGDMSERVMNIVSEHCADVEVYSIDEAFMRFDTQFSSVESVEKLCKTLRATILQCTSIPVSIGIGTTKTLAKLANKLSKKQPDTEGVSLVGFGISDFGRLNENPKSKAANPTRSSGIFTLSNAVETNEILAKIPVSDVWGVGGAYQKQLEYYGIKTVLDLKNASSFFIKKKFGVVLLRTVKELNGSVCLDLDPPIESRKNIMVSRSFRKDVYQYAELSEAISVYATRLGEKLRQYKQTTTHLTVFIWTNPFNRITKDHRIYFADSIELPVPTANTNELIHNALEVLKKLYRKDYNYKKAGILATELKPNTVIQGTLFNSIESELRSRDLMKIMDSVNKKYGKQTLYFSTCGTNHTWSRQEQFCSPRFTTRWEDIFKV